MTAPPRRLRIEPRPPVFTSRRPPDIGFIYIASDTLDTHIGATITPPSAMVEAMAKTYSKMGRLNLDYFAEVRDIPAIWPHLRAALVQNPAIVNLADLIALVRRQKTDRQEVALLTEWLASSARDALGGLGK